MVQNTIWRSWFSSTRDQTQLVSLGCKGLSWLNHLNSLQVTFRLTITTFLVPALSMPPRGDLNDFLSVSATSLPNLHTVATFVFEAHYTFKLFLCTGKLNIPLFRIESYFPTLLQHGLLIPKPIPSIMVYRLLLSGSSSGGTHLHNCGAGDICHSTQVEVRQ